MSVLCVMCCVLCVVVYHCCYACGCYCAGLLMSATIAFSASPMRVVVVYDCCCVWLLVCGFVNVCDDCLQCITNSSCVVLLCCDVVVVLCCVVGE